MSVRGDIQGHIVSFIKEWLFAFQSPTSVDLLSRYTQEDVGRMDNQEVAGNR